MSEPTYGRGHLEEMFTALEVLFEGETTPRRIVLARYTEGVATIGHQKWIPGPDQLTGTVPGSNRYGAYVTTSVLFIANKGVFPSQTMYLMEPWAGQCPWLPEQLDPKTGDNRLDEFMLPPEFIGVPMTLFDTGQLQERWNQMEARQAVADQRKAARLKAGAVVQDGKPGQ